MKKSLLALTCILLATMGISGCSTTGVERVDTKNDIAETTMGLEYRDFEQAAAEAIRSLLASGAVDHPKGERYVLVISRVVNDTMQRIDSEQLTKKIRIELLNTGKVVTTTALGANGAEDAMAYKARQLRNDDEFNQANVAQKGSLRAPDLSLSGKIIQRNLKMNRNTQQVEYSFMLTLTDINSGLAIWENETPIVKRGPSKSVSW